MAKRARGLHQYPVEVDTEDLKFRMYAAIAISGLSTKDVADYLGISAGQLTDTLDGHPYHLHLRFLVSFCAVVRCSLSDILPFANDEIPFPFSYTVPGGGAVAVMHPSPYKIAYSDPEDLADRRWFGMDPDI
jgi:DNA-binding Xre family transcriptional regulator